MFFSAPTKVTNVIVYSKEYDALLLRWKPPYPPNGRLVSYHVNYRCSSCHYYKGWYTLDVSPKNCTIWPDYHCGRLGKLYNSDRYDIQIRAKNDRVDELSEPVTLQNIKVEVSGEFNCIHRKLFYFC